MRRFEGIFLAVMGVFLSATPAVAQVPETGTLTRSKLGSSYVLPLIVADPDLVTLPSSAALRTARAMYACAVQKDPEDYRSQLLYGVRASKGAVSRLQKVLVGCLGRADPNGAMIATSGSTTVGLMGEAYLNHFGLPAMTPISVAELRVQPEWLEISSPLLSLATCLVAIRPEEVSALLLTPLGSPAEGAAFSKLTPSIPSCVPQNATMTIKRDALRVFLAAAAYDRAYRAPLRAAYTALQRKP